MNRRISTITLLFASLLFLAPGCGIYTMTGVATTAKTITIDQIFNNTDLAPANLAQTFSNRLKDYYQQNSGLRVVPEVGELAVEGVITDYRLSNMAPTASSTNAGTSPAALTRLTIAVKITYTDNLEPKNSFKDRQFSFYRDFDNNLSFASVQEDLEKKIMDQILLDIFNATVANW
ncbi:MAG: hypothetical protein K1X47_06170 [Cyclobacteriaceae bacterium]|nr:hypothetical protein [Cyclobacteriaceae bacterium]